MVKKEEDLGHIGVLMGGPSSEREISLKSGKAVYEALKAEDYQVTAIDLTTADENEVRKAIADADIDIAFLALHGKFGEDGTVQAILESMEIPYTGSGVEASRIAISKALTQKILKSKNVPVPNFLVLRRSDKISDDELLKELGGLPVVVKPDQEGSSIGVTIVRERKDLSVAIKEAFSFGPQVLVDKFIEGRELTVGILADEALPVIEIRPKEGFFDFTAKYQKGLTDYIVPAVLDEEVAARVQQAALQAYQAAGCCDFSRVDVMLDKNNVPYVLEINTIPGFTSTSLLPKAAKCRGYEFADLCVKLIKLAYEKEKQKKQ